jgi:hypothetical protein
MKTFTQDGVIHLLRRTQHVAAYGIHICGYCFDRIHTGERYVCHVYVSNRKVSQHKVHLGCYHPTLGSKP